MEIARDILAKADSARERGQTELAKESYELALRVALDSHDIVVASEVHAARAILNRRLAIEAKTTQERHRMLELATADVKSAMLLARQAEFMKDKTALPLALLAQAKVYELQDRLPEAISALSMAFPLTLDGLPIVHRRQSVVTHVQLELALLRLKNLDETEQEILRCIALLIEDTGADAQYNIPVWISGAYLSLAEHFIQTDIEKSKEYLQRAKRIIFFDDTMFLRKLDYNRVENDVLSSRM